MARGWGAWFWECRNRVVAAGQDERAWYWTRRAAFLGRSFGRPRTVAEPAVRTYFSETALPEVSLISSQDFMITDFTASGMGT